MGGKKNKGTNSRRTPSRDNRSSQQGTRLYQTHTMPHGGKGQNQVYALQPRDPRLVRRGQSPYPLPHIQTSAEKIRTFPHQESLIRCIIRTRTSGTMEDTPSDTC